MLFLLVRQNRLWQVDIVWDESKEVYLSELELFEPELWFREHSKSADMLAEAVKKYFNTINYL